jgi:hypothetical protein
MTTPWRIAAAAIAGPRHAQAGQASQDRFDVCVTRSGVLLAMVADGAGSAARGGEGAAMLCARVAERLQVFFDWGFDRGCSRAMLLGACRSVRDGIVDARNRLVGADEGGAGDGDLADFHSTLVGVALMPTGGGIAFQIGDGATLALDAGDRWVMSAPENGEYADTTFFFTQPDWRRHLRFRFIPPTFETVFVMTDGTTDLALTGAGARRTPFMPFFEPIGRFLAGATRPEGETALAATLDSDAARARSSDDKTLIWASRRPA